MLAKNVNDNACFLNKRGVCEFFASKLAPTAIFKSCYYAKGILNAKVCPMNSSLTRPERLLILGSTLTVLLIVGVVTALLIREHANTLQTAKRTANTITQLIDADVLRNVELYDMALKGLISATERTDLQDVSESIRHLVLFDRSAAAPYKGDILLLDPAGEVIADSSLLTPKLGNFADRDYFQAHRNNPDLGLYISRPFMARCQCDDPWRIAFSRRVSSADGRFLGVAVASMRLSYFHQLFSSLNIGNNSTINLLNHQGILLAQEPLLEVDIIDKDLSQRPNVARMLRERDGSFQSISSVDRQARLYSFSNVGDLPLIVAVALSSDEMFAPWRRAAWAGQHRDRSVVRGLVMADLGTVHGAAPPPSRRAGAVRTGSHRRPYRPGQPPHPGRTLAAGMGPGTTLDRVVERVDDRCGPLQGLQRPSWSPRRR